MATAKARSAGLDGLGKNSISIIDSILSQEEAKDVVSMMVMADEGDGSHHLPSFCTSTQMGGRNPQIRPRSPSLSPLSFSFPYGGRADAINFNPLIGTQNNRLVTEALTKGDIRNLKNSCMTSNTIICPESEICNSALQAGPGTGPEVKNRFSVLAQLGSGDLDTDSAPDDVLGDEDKEAVAMAGSMVTGLDTFRDGKHDVNNLDGSAEGVGGLEGNDEGNDEEAADDIVVDSTVDEASVTVEDPVKILCFDDIIVKMGTVDDMLLKLDGKASLLTDTVRTLEASLEFSQLEIDTLKKENEELKQKMGSLEIKDRRTQFQATTLEDKFDRLETQVKRKNLLFEGIPEPEGGKEDVARSTAICLTSSRSGEVLILRPATG